MKDYTQIQLIEKIVRAKIALEQRRMNHTCMIDMDPDYMGPCKCGAGNVNAAITAALNELQL